MGWKLPGRRVPKVLGDLLILFNAGTLFKYTDNTAPL